MKVPTCVKFKFGSIGAGVALQSGTIVQAQSVVTYKLWRLLRFGQLIGPHQTNSFEPLSHHDEFHPLSGQSYEPLLQSHESWNSVILGDQQQEETSEYRAAMKGLKSAMKERQGLLDH